jgi:Na+-driven multidrug efflux pump
MQLGHQSLHPCPHHPDPAGCRSYIWNALAIATVTLVAERLKDNDDHAASLALSCSLALAAAGGLLVCGVLQAWGPWLLARTGAEAAILPYALTYLRIRALAAPAAILLQVG